MRLPEKWWQPGAYSLGVYTLSRLMLLGALSVPRETSTPNPSFSSLVVRWDATYYLPLAAGFGYSGTAGDVRHTFFPLYPIVGPRRECRSAG